MLNHKRKYYLDSVRGIGIILVVLAHTNVGDNYLCNLCFSFCIPMLFILAGMTLQIQLSSCNDLVLSEVIVKKTINLMWPYLSFSILALLFEFIKGIILQHSISEIFISGTLSTFILEGFHALWFLPCLWIAEIIVLLLSFKGGDDKNIGKYIIFFFILGCILSKVVYYWNPKECFLIKRISIVGCRAILAVSFVLIGKIFMNVFSKYNNTHKGRTLICSLLLCVNALLVKVLGFSVDYYYLDIENPIIYLYFVITNTFCLLIIFKEVRCKILEWLGKNSMIIMCTHSPLPILLYVKKLLWITQWDIVNSIITCIVVLIIEFVICNIINRYFDIMIKPRKLV